MIKLIIFDFSDVCFTLEEPPFLKKFAKKHNVPFSEFESFYNELLYQAEVDTFSGTELWKQILQKYNLNENVDNIIAEMMDAKEAHQDILDVAKSLRSKYKTAYFTNYNHDYWIKIEQKFDLSPYFDWGIVSYQVKTRKPAKEGFMIILDHFHVKPEEAIFIDDQENNLGKAKELGIKTILYKDKEQLIQELQKYDVEPPFLWSHEKLEAVPLYLSPVSEALISLNKEYPVYFTQMYCFFEKSVAHWHYLEEEQEVIARYLVSKIEQDSSFSPTLVEHWMHDVQQWYAQYEPLLSFPYSTASSEKILSVFLPWYEETVSLLRRAFILEGFSFKADALVEQTLRTLGASTEDITILTTPTRKSFLKEAEEEICSLKDPALIKKKYSWLYNNYAGTGSFDPKNTSQSEQHSSPKISKEHILNKLHAPLSVHHLIQAIDDFAYWQDQRKKMVFHMIEILKTIVSHLANRLQIDKSLLHQLTARELIEVIKTQNLNKKLLSQRAKQCYFRMRLDTGLEIDTKDYAKLRAQIITKYSFSSEYVQGIVAQPGKVIGPAKIIMTLNDHAKFQQGDVLITSMTRPDFAPLFSKAAAIVTDDGGITCHAAIISREFRIPCIINTKNATTTFKDNDIVEVDAIKGTIRRVKS